MSEINIGEDTESTPDELLDWLCWHFASMGERFYPPDETAEACIESLELDDEYSKGVEHGQHGRAWGDAREFFKDLEYRGYDPKARAQRHVERARENGLDLPDIGWEWLDE